jgi:hypothetical protein
MVGVMGSYTGPLYSLAERGAAALLLPCTSAPLLLGKQGCLIRR